MIRKNIGFQSLIIREKSDKINVCLGVKAVEKMSFAMSKKAVIYYSDKNDRESSIGGNEHGRK